MIEEINPCNENAIMNSKYIFSAAEKIKDGIIVFDKNSKITFINSSALDMLGYSPLEMHVKEWISKSGFYFPDAMKKITLRDIQFNKAISGAPSDEFTALLRNEFISDDILIEGRFFPFTGDESLSGAFFVFRNITETSNLLKKLDNITTRLNESQKAGKTGSWEFDVQTEQITWSDQVFEMFCRDKNLGAPTFEEYLNYFNKENAGQIDEYMSKAIKTGNRYEFEVAPVLANKEIRHHLNIITPVKDYARCVVKIIGTVQDISEIRKIEARSVQCEAKVKDIEKSFNEKKYALSHDIKNQIINIKTGLKKINESIKMENPEQNKQLYDKILLSVDRIETLLNNHDKEKPE